MVRDASSPATVQRSVVRQRTVLVSEKDYGWRSPGVFTPDGLLALADKERLAVFEPVVVNEAFVRRHWDDAGDALGAGAREQLHALVEAVLVLDQQAELQVRVEVVRRDLELAAEGRGRVVTAGMGKAGFIAQKISATFASTGTPSHFVHPAEASHGDLGMIENGDVFIAISYSGASEELVQIVPQIKRRGAKLIAITGKPGSALAREADVHLDAAVAQEA